MKRCRACRFFSPTVPAGEPDEVVVRGRHLSYGVCMAAPYDLTQGDDGARAPIVALAGGDPGRLFVLRVRQDFGCVRWQRPPPEAG